MRRRIIKLGLAALLLVFPLVVHRQTTKAERNIIVPLALITVEDGRVFSSDDDHQMTVNLGPYTQLRMTMTANVMLEKDADAWYEVKLALNLKPDQLVSAAVSFVPIGEIPKEFPLRYKYDEQCLTLYDSDNPFYTIYFIGEALTIETKKEETLASDWAEVVRCREFVNLRKGPGTDQEVIAKVPLGTIVQVQSARVQSGEYDWWQIIYHDKEGWIRADFLEPVDVNEEGA